MIVRKITYLLQQDHFRVINTHLLLWGDESLSNDINNYLFYIVQTFIQESGRFIQESCFKLDVIFQLSKSKIVTIITIPFNICIFSYHNSCFYIIQRLFWLIDWIEFYAVSAIFQPCNGGSTVVSFRTSCLFGDEDLVSCNNLRPNHLWYIQ